MCRPVLQPWIDARRKFRLSHAHVQMARELGLNPKKLGKLNNHPQETVEAAIAGLHREAVPEALRQGRAGYRTQHRRNARGEACKDVGKEGQQDHAPPHATSATVGIRLTTAATNGRTKAN
jgi:hypothetical protein